MIDINGINRFKEVFLDLIDVVFDGDGDKEEMYLSSDYDLIKSLRGDFDRLDRAIELLIDARRVDDKLAIRASLLEIRIFLMSIAGVFYRTSDDIDMFFQKTSDDVFPVGYEIPEHYNYPRK